MQARPPKIQLLGSLSASYGTTGPSKFITLLKKIFLENTCFFRSHKAVASGCYGIETFYQM